MHTSKTAKVVMVSLVLTSLIAGLVNFNTPVVKAAGQFDWNVTRNDFVGDCSQGPWFVNRSSLKFGGTATNGSSDTIRIRSAAFHSNTAGCSPTTESAGSGLSLSGKTVFGPGESGDFMFSYVPSAYTCGRVQLDALFVNQNGEAVSGIFGVVLNYGVNCGSSTPNPTPNTTPSSTPNSTPSSTPNSTPNPTPLITPQPGTLTAVCVGGTSPRVNLNWGNGVNQNSNSVQRQQPGGSWQFIFQDPTLGVRSYTDTTVAANTNYIYRIKYGANVASNEVTVNTSAASCGGTSPTPTPTPVQILPGTLSGVCVNNNSIVLNWTSGVNANSNSIQKGDLFPDDPNRFWDFIFGDPTLQVRTFTDTNIVPGVTYKYRVKYAPAVPSNEISVSCPTSTPTPTPTPTPSNLICSPSTQTVGSGIPATFIATGGTGIYFWSAPFGEPSTGLFSVFNTRFFTGTPVMRYVTVTSGNNSATCSVYVVPTAPATLSISKLGKDITRGQASEQVSLNVKRNDTLEFDLHVRNNSNTTATNVIVTDRLPGGVLYLAHTTSIGGLLVNDGIASGGINIGTLAPGQEILIRFHALVSMAAFPAGVSQVINFADVRADNIPTITAQMPVNLIQVLGAVSQVKTGPTDSIFLSLLLSAMATMMYVGYTRTSIFTRRDAMAALQRHRMIGLNFANRA